MRMTLKLAVLSAAILLSACGQQGPLYFPEDAPAQNTAPAQTETAHDTQAQDPAQQ
ncbi:LPS translocon maturation chaperone LptM [Enterovibrio nigricans]|uniref:LPS translocon maturation chaperone LptM n=1 Tax=Enterovibrio nigricans TaxID=504469 RepID=UPI00099AA60C|nr:lipoprotein [Enterovibrio nigricans]PKF51367.1 hypothetical protein AT251_04315 [Enterovibrio nigricans]